ncbi:hypothetical protein DVR12_21145 [Chitinophaga silvatica]|uniref:Uncharacterized protein n=1 Tax=Chitinophaga silvatica TaxID=2282649 RepID=A0A3E1Y659_9BACT|nr:tetratricopeptide repeat protein [Chitinophaga silvatica]RFS20223.1 hypothetical protein DVR12_21145 [Chitinophaga silvatica]
MGLFDFLKGKNTSNNQVDKQSKDYEEYFEEEVLKAIPRYICKPGADVNIKVRHQETNEVISFAQGFPEQFNTWKKVKSLADKRGIIYSLLDFQLAQHLELWQTIERFNDDRYAQRALELANKYKNDADEQNPDFQNALARTYFILTQYEEAEQHCLAALELAPTNIRSKRIYADILHCTNRQEKAHQLYEEILNEKLPKGKQISLSIKELLGFNGDVTNSPIYALMWLRDEKNISDEIWEWANNEFYYSPHFRSQYAYWLIEKKEYLRGFAKLLSLVKEMPWFTEAAINCYNLMKQLNLQDSMQEEKSLLEKIMANTSH